MRSTFDIDEETIYDGKDIAVTIEWSEEDSVYVAIAPLLSGCATHGDTREEAAANITEAIELHLRSVAKHSNQELIEIEESAKARSSSIVLIKGKQPSLEENVKPEDWFIMVDNELGEGFAYKHPCAYTHHAEIHVIEKSAYDKAIAALKLYADFDYYELTADRGLGPSIEDTAGKPIESLAHETLKALGES